MKKTFLCPGRLSKDAVPGESEVEHVVVHGGPDATLDRAELARYEDGRRSMPGGVKGRQPDLQERTDAVYEKLPRRVKK